MATSIQGEPDEQQVDVILDNVKYTALINLQERQTNVRESFLDYRGTESASDLRSVH
jgi:hypothetical protein